MSHRISRRLFLSAAFAGITAGDAFACWRRKSSCPLIVPCPPQPWPPQPPGPPQPGVRVRPNIMSLTPPQLDSLKRGIAAMKALPASDPRSWAFQAAIHGTLDTTATNPLFNQCQHGTIQFLTWHRGYLHFFERILRAASGDPALNLPYWDWSTNPAIPEPYRTPADTSNSLYEDSRALNDGSELTPNVVDLDLATAMGSTGYSGSLGFSPRLEDSPHGTVHTQIGGKMSSVKTAALDPIFWLHHANIDRLWNVWLNQGGSHINPADASFLGQTYSFADENGQTATVRVGDIINSAQLGYQYEGVPNPASIFSAVAAPPMPVAGLPPSRVAATSAPAEKRGVPLEKVEAKPLGYRVERVKLNAVKEARAALAQPVPVPGVYGQAAPHHLAVAIEGLSADTAPTATFEVYLDLPEREERDPAARRKYYIGSINFFGKTRSAKQHGVHQHGNGDSFTQTFDATRVIARLQQERRWNPDNLSITFIPVNTVSPSRTVQQAQARVAAGVEAAKVKYKRVTLRTISD